MDQMRTTMMTETRMMLTISCTRWRIKSLKYRTSRGWTVSLCHSSSRWWCKEVANNSKLLQQLLMKTLFNSPHRIIMEFRSRRKWKRQMDLHRIKLPQQVGSNPGRSRISSSLSRSSSSSNFFSNNSSKLIPFWVQAVEWGHKAQRRPLIIKPQACNMPLASSNSPRCRKLSQVLGTDRNLGSLPFNIISN